MQITEHFALEEFKQPARHDMSELDYPEQWVTDRLTPLCQQLEIIREKLGGHPIHIISGYRSPAYNAAIGGATQSQHMQGKAADIVVEGVDPLVVHDSILQMSKAKVIEIGGLGEYNTFTHVDIRSGLELATWSGKHVTDVVAC